MKRVLLTGATGFLGRQCLAPLLTRGFEVHALSFAGKHEGDDARVHWHRVDLMSPAAVATVCESVRATHLLHMAWYTEHGMYWTSAENLRWVAATLELARQFHAAGGRRLVSAGTCAEYDWSAGECDERLTARRPATLYGVSKDATRRILESFAAAAGFSQAWGHIFFLFGPDEPPARLVPSVIESLLRGETARCSLGTQLRDFLYSSDVADAFAALLDSDVRGPVNIGSGDPMTIRTLAERIRQRLGGSIDFGAIPMNPADPAALTATTRRLREEVGWRPRVTIDQAIDQTIEWWKARPHA